MEGIKPVSVLDMTVREAFRECSETLERPNGAVMVRGLAKENGNGTGGVLIVVVGEEAARDAVNAMRRLGAELKGRICSEGKKYLDEKGRVLRVFFDPHSDMYGTYYEHPSDTGMVRLRSRLLPMAETDRKAQELLDEYANEKSLQAIPTPEEVRDLLMLVTTKVPPLDRVESWTDLERAEAARWAAATHLRASDNPVRIPPVPNVMIERKEAV